MSVRFKWNIKGFKELRKSAEVQKRLEKDGKSIASKAEGNYVVKTDAGSTRARTAVITEDIETIRANSKNNDLLRALGGG